MPRLITADQSRLASAFVDWLRENAADDESLGLLATVLRYVRVARAAGYYDYGMASVEDRLRFPSGADIDKSALLDRLLAGKEPLPSPPPTCMSYPWYAVVEEPGPHGCEVGGAVTLGALIGQPEPDGRARVVVNQAVWIVEREVAGDELHVRWRDGQPLYRLWRNPEHAAWEAAGRPPGRYPWPWLIQRLDLASEPALL